MKRTGSAYWQESRATWRIDVQKDGVRRTFYSSKPGRTGQREANRKADAWLDEGIHDSTSRIDELWALYVENLSLTAGDSAIEQAEKIGRNYVLPVIGRTHIEDLTEGALQQVIDRSYKSGCLRKGARHRADPAPLSRKTLQSIRAAEMSFCKWARRNGYTSLLPEGLTIPSGARYKGKEILQPDALRVLFTVDTIDKRGKLQQDRYIYYYRFAVSTGLRPGELLGMQCRDVKDGVATIRRAINYKKHETQGKNENALRSFTLNAYALEAYRQQLLALVEYGLPHSPTSPLWPCASQNALYQHWQTYQEKNGIEPRISMYELRHTFVSVVQDLPGGDLKALVGHSKSMDTLGTYGHDLRGKDKQRAQAVYDAFSLALNA